MVVISYLDLVPNFALRCNIKKSLLGVAARRTFSQCKGLGKMAGPIPAHTTNLVVTPPLLTFELQLHVVALLLAIDDPRC